MFKSCIVFALIMSSLFLPSCDNREETGSYPQWLRQLVDTQQAAQQDGPRREEFYDRIASLKEHIHVIERNVGTFSNHEAVALTVGLTEFARREARSDYLRICDLLEARWSGLRFDTIVVYEYYDIEFVGSRYVAILQDNNMPWGIRDEAAEKITSKWKVKSYLPLQPEVLPVCEGVLVEEVALWLKVRVLILMRVLELASSPECLVRLDAAIRDHPDEIEQAEELIQELRALCEQQAGS
ncbi:MAG: hypothetical protein IH984_16065 [Planctomycetes bacterium]|nr:hypothetical protein [Planctomycetota bacterium]